MASKAFLIDAAAREIREVEVKDYREINTHLGSDCFCVAWQFGNADVLYVDDEGMLKGADQKHFFWLSHRTDQPLVGNGLVMGADNPRDDSESLPPATTIDELRAAIRFSDRAEALEWAHANPDALKVTVTTIAADGTTETQVLGSTMPVAFPETQAGR
jgi:hypothetical protein